MAGHIRHRCERCLDRRALFQYRGMVKADRHHTLCFACFRSERDRAESRRLVAATSEGAVTAPRASLSPAQRAHRFRMLAHLERQRRGRAQSPRGGIVVSFGVRA